MLPVTALLAACSPAPPPPGDWPWEAEPTQWSLPDGLDEISGLALDGRGRLFGHDDEHAVVYELDTAHGAIVGRFAIGEPRLRGDFEDIAIVGEDFYLLTSDGVLHRFREGADGAAVPYEDVDTGLGARCEFEGLAWDAASARLWLACKTVHDATIAGRVAVFAFDPATRRTDEARSWTIDEAALAMPIGKKRFRPSAIEPVDGGRVLLLSGTQRALAQVDAAGAVVNVWTLDPGRHAQPEGLAVTQNGDLIVADEGKKGRGRLAVYRRR
jgi:uncharacterized protein YjiK